FHCLIRLDFYPMPVHVFIPNKLQKNKEVSLLFYFHGWRLEGSPSPFEGRQGDFRSFIEKAQWNGIIIVPESLGPNITYQEYFLTPQAANNFFEAIITEIQFALDTTERLSFGFAGHSGAYVILDKLAEWLLEGSL